MVPDINVEFLIFAFILMNLASFLLGYDIAETRERDAKKKLDRAYKLEAKRRYELGKWVRANWPNEYAAFSNGQAEGFQRGFTAAEDDRDALST